MFDHRNNHKPVWKMGSLLSTYNTQVRTILQLLKFPAAWFVSVSSWCLEIWSSTFLIFSCWKAAWAVAPKPQLWKPFIWNCPCLIYLCSIMENRLLKELFAALSFLNPLAHFVHRFCLSLLLRMFPSWSRMKQAKLLLVSFLLTKRLHAAFNKFAVGAWFQLLKSFPTKEARNFLISRAAEALTMSQGSSLGKVSAASSQ